MTRRTALLATVAAPLRAATDPAAEKEVLAAMEVWRQAFLKKDQPTLRRILHEDLIYSHSNGKRQNKAEFLDEFLKGQYYALFDLSDTIVHIHGTSALVSSTLDIRSTGGADRPFLVKVLHAWVKGPQGWQLAARTATRLNPPQ